MKYIELKNVSKIYNNKVVALDNVSLTGCGVNEITLYLFNNLQ